MKPLPVHVRRITLAVIALSGLVGFASAQGIAQVVELEKLRSLDPIALPLDALASPKKASEAARAMLEAEVQALESMQTSRMLTLLGLTIASTLTFVGALRMIRPAGAAREDVRKLLASTAVVCAVLRTIDGAQMTVVAKRIGAAGDRVMLTSDVPGGYPEGLMAMLLGFTSIGMTLVVAGGFLGMSMYFRSSGLRAAVEAADRSREET